MKLSDLGEREIIEQLSQEIDIGDDAAWVPFGDSYLIFSNDMLHEETHLLPKMSWRQLGKLVVTLNLSDIAAMGAQPQAFLLSYASSDVEREKFRQIIQGVKEHCEKFEVKFAGGDTNEIPQGLILGGSILGKTDHPILRSNAQAGDLIGITGELGAGYITEILLKGKEIKLEHKELMKKTLEQEPRVKEGLILQEHANSLTDVSDSLAVSLHSLARQSEVGTSINLDKLPLALDFDVSYALYKGGDYELLFTFPENKLSQIQAKLNFSVIGKITKKKEIVGFNKEGQTKIEKEGYEHFSR